jgi:DNA helicase IV
MATENPTVSELLQKKFKHNPTTGQTKLFELMDNFLEQEDEIIRSAFILKGYAGTGKTTFISEGFTKVWLEISLAGSNG